jgi:hypothetical protein
MFFVRATGNTSFCALFAILGFASASPCLARESARWIDANELCKKAYVAELMVGKGIDAIRARKDYCALPVAQVPIAVRTVLEAAREVNERVADTLGYPPRTLYGYGVHLRLVYHPTGNSGSVTFAGEGTWGGIELSAFRDFDPARFPKEIYAHELAHLLVREKKLGSAAELLESRFLFGESFSDLVASYAMKILRIGPNDSGLSAALLEAKDFTPVKSMRVSFTRFSVRAYDEQLESTCRTVLAGSPTRNDRELCAHYGVRSNASSLGTDRASPDKKLFRAENCLARASDGSRDLGGCQAGLFSPVFVSFIRSIDGRLGTRPIKEILRSVSKSTRKLDRIRCAFTGPDADAWKPSAVTLEYPSVVKMLQALRAIYPADGWPAFDAAWSAHGLDEWKRIEKLEREIDGENSGYLRLIEENPRFSAEFGCDSERVVARVRPCAFRCQGVSGSEL